MLKDDGPPGGTRADPHTHTVDETACMVRGRASVCFRGESYEIKVGDSWVVPVGDSRELLAHEHSLCVFAFSPMRREYAEDKGVTHRT
jgi:quercetin dioxygenase-like cupin family protein